jgi:hypothetical protein
VLNARDPLRLGALPLDVGINLPVRRLALALVALLVPLCAQAQLYKCVDEHGRTNYRDQPAAGCKAVDIRPSQPLSGALQGSQESFAVRDADLKRRQLERDASAAQERETKERRCADLRRENIVLSSGARISKLNEQGERVYMEDASRDRRLAQLAQELRACP